MYPLLLLTVGECYICYDMVGAYTNVSAGRQGSGSMQAVGPCPLS